MKTQSGTDTPPFPPNNSVTPTDDEIHRIAQDLHERAVSSPQVQADAEYVRQHVAPHVAAAIPSGANAGGYGQVPALTRPVPVTTVSPKGAK
jgi:hypothetical protein